jgi:hypothetical protein
VRLVAPFTLKGRSERLPEDCQMYKAASRNHQTILSRGRPADWVGTGEDHQSPADALRSMQRAVRAVDVQLAALPPHERTALRARKAELDKAIVLHKRKHPELKHARGMPDHFVDRARELLPPATFKMIFQEARRRCDAASVKPVTMELAS